MPLPKPFPGMVICYEFLWGHEHDSGQTQGQKRRPCVVVLSVSDRFGATRVTVAPITHVEPKAPRHGVEVPPRVKRSLNLDDQRSWIIATELNRFIWPGDYVFPIPGGRRDQYTYGVGAIPERLLDMVIQRIEALGDEERRSISRDDR